MEVLKRKWQCNVDVGVLPPILKDPFISQKVERTDVGKQREGLR